MSWCNAQQIQCLYFLADASDAATVSLAEDNGFRFVDIRLKFEKRLEKSNQDNNREAGEVIRLCRTPDDIPALRAIAGKNHRDTRFYYDPNFPSSTCDALYETWIENSCLGYADAVLVADIQGQIAGYISCHLRPETRGEIGLVGVAAPWQGQGLGQKLVNASLNWFSEQGVTSVSVVTQGRNSQAQRLYQRCGFLTESVYLWYHKWFSLSEGNS